MSDDSIEPQRDSENRVLETIERFARQNKMLNHQLQFAIACLIRRELEREQVAQDRFGIDEDL